MFEFNTRWREKRDRGRETGEEREKEKGRGRARKRQSEKGRGIDRANDFKLGVKNLRQRRR